MKYLRIAPISISLSNSFKDDFSFELYPGMKLCPMPEWVREKRFLRFFGHHQIHRITHRQYCLSVEFHSEAIGSPGQFQDGAAHENAVHHATEMLKFSGIAIQIAHPGKFSFDDIYTFQIDSNDVFWREIHEFPPIRYPDLPNISSFNLNHLEIARNLLKSIINLKRNGTIWNVIHLLSTWITSNEFIVRFSLAWFILESLFSPESPGELSYRLSNRMGFFLGKNRDQAKAISKQVKESYGLRSVIVHGRGFKKTTTEKINACSLETESWLRQSLLKILLDENYKLIFNSRERDEYLDELQFKKSI